MRNVYAVVVVCLWSGLAASAVAQSRQPDHTRELSLIESTERDEDPLGFDDSTGRGLDEAARALAPKVVLPSPAQGQGLSGIEALREARHAVSVSLEQGLAFVHVEMSFESRHPQYAAELAYRLALPDGAVVHDVRICADACAQAAPDSKLPAREAETGYARWLTRATPGAAARPGAWAELIEDGRGTALALRVAPIPPRGTLRVQVRYVAEAPLRGGRVRLRLPPRGEDPRLAPMALRVSAAGLEGPDLQSERAVEAFHPAEIVASLAPGSRPPARSARVACGSGSCERRYEARAPMPLNTRSTWVLIDASPSMEGPARGRVDAVLAGLLSALPPDTPLRAFAFGALARELGAFSAERAPLGRLSEAVLLDLGAGTRPSSVLESWARALASDRPRVLVVSDGRLDPSPKERRALDDARRAGAEPWLIALGDEPPAPGQAGGFEGVVHVPELADEVLRGRGLEALEDALRGALSPRSAGLRAGEQAVREQAPRTAFHPRRDDPWLTFWSARTPSHWLLAEGAAAPTPEQLPIRALAFTSVAPKAPPAPTSMPAESVLDMLRTQLVPQARGCLRSDRKGRGDYAVALTFRALFAQREVLDARVEGAVPGPLRSCLEGLLPKLRVPAFSGAIRVRYPIHTEREAPEPVIELASDVAADVERVIRGP